MFARWCQENFFRYMRQHYNLDRLAEYGVEPVPDTIRVINPAWRQLDSQIRRLGRRWSRPRRGSVVSARRISGSDSENRFVACNNRARLLMSMAIRTLSDANLGLGRTRGGI